MNIESCVFNNLSSYDKLTLTFDSSNTCSITNRGLSEVTKSTFRQSNSCGRTCNTSNQ